MNYIKELDSLRAIAAIWVILFHLYPEIFFFPVPGVDLFFVISGYLVTGIILSKKEDPKFFRTYIARRFLRIAPVYYIGLSFVLFVIPNLSTTHQPTEAWPYFISFTQYIPQVWGGDMPQFIRRFDHSWTLAIEVQFYLIIPIFICKISERFLPVLLVTAIAVSFLFRLNNGPVWTLIGRMDGLVMGVALAFIFKSQCATLKERAIKCVSILSLLSVLFLGYFVLYEGKQVVAASTCPSPEWIFLAVNLASTGVVAYVILNSGRKHLKILRLRCMRYLGQISYGLYLYHPLMFWLVDGLTERLGSPSILGGITSALVKIAMTLIVSALSWSLIEKPVLKLKRHFNYS